MTASAFENFYALDWASRLFEFVRPPAEMVDELRRVLHQPLQAPPYDELTTASAIAAGEIVAHCLGRGRGKLPDYVESWIKRHGGLVGIQDARVAREAVSCLIGSRCRALTCNMADDDLKEFTLYVRGLRARLSNAAVPRSF